MPLMDMAAVSVRRVSHVNPKSLQSRMFNSKGWSDIRVMSTEYCRLEAGHGSSNLEILIFFWGISGFYLFHDHFVGNASETGNKNADLTIGASGDCILLTACSTPYRFSLSKETGPPVISYRSGIISLTRNLLSFTLILFKRTLLFWCREWGFIILG